MTLPVIAGAVVSLVQILGWNSITVLHDDADDDLGNYYLRQVILLHVNSWQLIRRALLLITSNQWSLIWLLNDLQGHYSRIYFVHRHLNNAWYNKANSVTGKPYLAIIASASSLSVKRTKGMEEKFSCSLSFTGSLHALLPMYMDRYMYVMQYDIRKSHLKQDVSKFLDSMMNERRNTNVLVMCGTICFQEIIYQVNTSGFSFLTCVLTTICVGIRAKLCNNPS